MMVGETRPRALHVTPIFPHGHCTEQRGHERHRVKALLAQLQRRVEETDVQQCDREQQRNSTESVVNAGAGNGFRAICVARRLFHYRPPPKFRRIVPPRSTRNGLPTGHLPELGATEASPRQMPQ